MANAIGERTISFIASKELSAIRALCNKKWYGAPLYDVSKTEI